MTIDELLADLKAKHGEEWIDAAIGLAIQAATIPQSLMTVQQYQLAQDMLGWLRSMVVAGVAATGIAHQIAIN